MSLRAVMPSATTTTLAEERPLTLRCYSYDDRRETLAAVTDVVSSGGCWLRERRAISFTQVEFLFEMQLRVALDVYSALIAAGLELAQSAHAELTGLCTVRRYRQRMRPTTGQVVTVRLDVHFIEDVELDFAHNSAGLA